LIFIGVAQLLLEGDGPLQVFVSILFQLEQLSFGFAKLFFKDVIDDLQPRLFVEIFFGQVVGVLLFHKDVEKGRIVVWAVDCVAFAAN